MKIVQIVSGMYIASAGPSYSIARLSDEMARCGNEVSIVTSGRRPSSWPYQTPLHASSRWLDNHLSVSTGFARELRAFSRENDILHGHSMWRFANNVFPLVLDRDSPAKIVCSPRGSMSAWSMQYKGLVKQPFWRLIQKPALQRCHCFHATSHDEYESIRALGLRAPVAVIPNGVDIPDLPAKAQRRRQVVFLGRINPVKGIDMLIRAWPGISRQYPDWELVIAGPLEDEYAREMQKLASEVCMGSAIRFTGELLGEQKNALLSGASLFVLPSHSENFGMVVAEALVHGLPVITTTGTPWADLTSRNCGWQVAPEQSAIAAAMLDAMGRPADELLAMGENGRAWMGQEYAWPRIAEMMLESYKWLHETASCPDWVIRE